MKKLMITAAAALCATVGFGEGIESANIVGYQTKDVRKNISQQVCTFEQIGVEGGALDLQKLIPVDANGDTVGGGEVTIQFISAFGVLQTSYAFFGADEVDDGYAAGWYDDNAELADYMFNAGQAFQVYSSTAANFIYSGEVNMAETAVPFGKNISVQGNIRPMPVDIQSVIPIDNSDEMIGGGEVTIQFVSAFGVLQTSYAFFGADEVDDGYAAGWYDDNAELAEYSFAAGEGFKLYAGQAGYLQFPELSK